MTAWVSRKRSRIVAGQPAPASGPAFITGVSASTSTQAGYFTDQHGSPRLFVWDEPYGLIMNAGRWNGSGGGTWQQDFDSYCSARAAQGINTLLAELIGTPNQGGVFANGNTWDNVPPFVTGQDPASGLNPAYWGRVDYMFASALASGITVTPALDIVSNISQGGTCFSTWGTTQYQAYGAALGARYKNQPNLIWLFGDDCFPGASGSNFEPFFDAFLAGMASAGYSPLVAAWWEAEYTSRYATDTNVQSVWGAAHSAFNGCYTYIPGYWVIEYAYGEVANQGAPALLPPVWLDGFRFSGAATYDHTNDRAWRQELWWTLAAGARGITTYSTNNYQWDSASSPASVTTDWSFVNALPHIVSAYQSWQGWNYLLPDLSSALVTAGRGTRIAGEVSGGSGIPWEPQFTNNWVAASKTPDGTLAVCYLPNSTTITVNTALLATGWAASWIDPVTGAASSAGTGPTFNSTAKGANSQGDPDWVLVFRGP